MFPNSNFDDWKWATEQSCIHIESTSCKIPSFSGLIKRLIPHYKGKLLM